MCLSLRGPPVCDTNALYSGYDQGRLCTARSQKTEVMLPVSLRAVCKGRGLTADVLGGGDPAKGGLCRTQGGGAGHIGTTRHVVRHKETALESTRGQGAHC